MRILQICSARYIGGGERHVADLSNALVDRGHDVFAAVAPGSPVVADLDNIAASDVATLPLRNAVDLVSAVKIARFVRQNRIELIHAHIAKDYLIAAAAARLANIPYIITRHVLFPMNRVHRRLLTKASYVIAVSNAIAKQLQSDDIFPPRKIVTIRYGIDIDRFPEPAPKNSETCRVGTIGNLDPVKGMDVFVRAAALICARRFDIEFEIIGEDRSRSRANEKELRDLISDLDLENQIVLTGWSNDIGGRLADIDVFVSASRSESFGAAMAEAMLSGVAVVATETEGAKEIISDATIGQLVPIDSPEAIAGSILELLENPEKRHELGRAGRSHVIENFSLERMVSEIESLYRSVIH